MGNASAPVKYAGRRYVVLFSLVLMLYGLAASKRHWIAGHVNDGALVAKLLPIVFIWLLLAVVWRYYLRIDEFARKRFLEATALTFGITSCTIVSYAFLTGSGLPLLGITWAWPTLASIWLLASGIQATVRR